MRSAGFRFVDAEPWAEEFFSRTPLNWVRTDHPFVAFQKIADTLSVVVSGAVEADGKRWIHVSCSRPSRLPNWAEVREVKDAFIGKDRKAIQVLPPEAEYVNIHPHCLHLWCCLDGDGLPDFRKDGAI